MSQLNLPDAPPGARPITLRGEFSKKLVTNTLFNLVGRSWTFLITLLLTPYILSRLSVGDFGTWVLLSIFMNSFNVLDLGLGSSFIKYISEFYTYKDFDRINRVLFSGLVFYALLGIVQLSIGLLLERPLFELFHIPPSPRAYFLVLLSCALSNVTAMFLSVIKGIQRMDQSNSLEIRISLLNALGAIVFLELGWGIFGLALNALVNVCCGLVLAWFAVRRIVPQISLGFNFDAKLLRNMFGYGIKLQVSQICSFICFRVDKLIVSRFLGVAAVSFYEVSSRLASFMRALPLVMISALIPATSELGARKDRARILQTYLLASKYVAMLTVAMAVFLALEARSVLTFWLGSGFDNSVILVQILAIGYAANVLGGAASQTGAGVGRPEFDMRGTVLMAVLNPVLGVLLVRQFGAAGAAAGTTLAFLTATLYLLIAFHRHYIKNSVRTVLRETYAGPIVAAVAASLAVSGFHQVTPQLLAWESIRHLAPVKIAADFGIFAPMYILLLVAFRQFTAMDWNNLTGLLSFGIHFVRHPFRERAKSYR